MALVAQRPRSDSVGRVQGMSGTEQVGTSRPGGMSRREFLRLGGVGLAGATMLGGGTLAGCGESGGSDGLTVASWDVASDALKATVPLFKKNILGLP